MQYVRATNFGLMAMHSLFNWRYGDNSFREAKTRRLLDADSQFHFIREFDVAFSAYPWRGQDQYAVYVQAEDGVKLAKATKGEDSILYETDPRFERNFPKWLAAGLLETVPVESKSLAQIAHEIMAAEKQYPYFSADRVSVELTGICNLACTRCYRGGSRPSEFGLPVELIKSALRPFLVVGTPVLNMTGGEATLRMRELFEILEFAKSYLVLDTSEVRDNVSILSNGAYAHPREFLGNLKELGGVTLRITLSSFNERQNDLESGRPGTFAKIRRTVEVAKEIGFPIEVMAHDIGGHADPEAEKNRAFFEVNAAKLTIAGVEDFERIGGAALSGIVPIDLPFPVNNFGVLKETEESHQPGWCRCLSRPHAFFLRPNGNVGPCLYTSHLAEEFGNLYRQPMVEIINRIQDSEIYRLFRNGNIERRQHQVDRNLFPGSFSKPCVPMVVTLTFAGLYEKFLANGFSPRVAKRMANEEAAKLTGFKRQ